MNPLYPIYDGPAIDSVKALAEALSISETELLNLSNTSKNYYKPNKPEKKKNGKVRQTYRVIDPLYTLHKRLVNELLDRVRYPVYILSAHDPVNPRGHVRNASLHVGQFIVINEDISNFFPSVKSKFVVEMWTGFFGFPKEVAKTLTNLTMLNGFLPQGAQTSSHIADLLFWDVEPQVEYSFRVKGLLYTRYVDDLTVSSNSFVDKKDQSFIITSIYMMFKKKGLKPERSKRSTKTRARGTEVHHLNITQGKPTLTKSTQSKIRAAVKQCEEETNRASSDYFNLYSSTVGRVEYMATFHPGKAKKLRNRLDAIRPVPAVSE